MSSEARAAVLVDGGAPGANLRRRRGVAGGGCGVSERERVVISHAAWEAAMLRVGREMFPGRSLRVEWDEPDTLGDVAASRADNDRSEHAA
jgi:hypothetical protein